MLFFGCSPNLRGPVLAWDSCKVREENQIVNRSRLWFDLLGKISPTRMTRCGIGRPESPGAVDQGDRGRFEADGPEAGAFGRFVHERSPEFYSGLHKCAESGGPDAFSRRSAGLLRRFSPGQVRVFTWTTRSGALFSDKKS